MNKKIFTKLLGYSQNDLTKITQPFIKETFGVEVKRCDSIEEYVNVIDDACLHKYFKVLAKRHEEMEIFGTITN